MAVPVSSQATEGVRANRRRVRRPHDPRRTATAARWLTSARTWPPSSTSAVVAGRTPRSAIRQRWSATRSCDDASRASGFGDATHTRLLRALPGRALESTGAPPVGALASRQRRRGAARARSPPHRRHECWRSFAPTARFAGVSPASWTNFLTDWGFRSSGELMLTTPTLEEQPEPVISLLQQYIERERGISRGHASRGRRRSGAPRRPAILQHARRSAHRPAPPSTWLLLRSTQIAVACRERARLKQALLYTRCRRVALRIGDSARLERAARESEPTCSCSRGRRSTSSAPAGRCFHVESLLWSRSAGTQQPWRAA